MTAHALPRFPRGRRDDGMPVALTDRRRLAAVRATGQLDTPREEAFDHLAELAAAITGCGRAFITLVDEHRSFWKACVGEGLDELDAARRQNPVRESFCHYLVGLEGEPFVVADAAADPRTADHPSVGPMRIGAWAGHPVLGPGGEVLGGVCVVDDVPHDWRQRELTALASLARAVSNELRLRQSLAATRQALDVSMRLARSLHDDLLPSTLPAVDHVDLAAGHRAADGRALVLGDFYDVFRAKGVRWSLVVGDVGGVDVDAARIATLARHTLRAAAGHHPSPAVALQHLNATLLQQTRPEDFLTAAHATFRAGPDGVTGLLCGAGCPPALVRRRTGVVDRVGRPGHLLGVLPDPPLGNTHFSLEPGDTLLLHTDGAVQARPPLHAADRDHPAFDEDVLADAFAALGDAPAGDVVDELIDTITRHARGRVRDDIALLALRVPAAG